MSLELLEERLEMVAAGSCCERKCSGGDGGDSSGSGDGGNGGSGGGDNDPTLEPPKDKDTTTEE